MAVPDGEIEADGIVLAVPAPVAAGLIRPVAPAAVRELAAVRFGASAVVLLQYEPQSLGRPLDGSGYLVPRGEGLAHAACSWLTSKWPNESTEVWLRAMVTSPVALAADDGALQDTVAREVGGVMAASTEPLEIRLLRWDQALPVYAPGHLERVARVEAALPGEMAVAGASYRGLGVPDCIASGRAAATHLLVSART